MKHFIAAEARRWNVSDDYWRDLSHEHRALYERVRPLQQATYEVDVGLNHLESFIESTRLDVESSGGLFNLEPDFQRGHVWLLEQRRHFVEAVIRGAAPGRVLFNCPGWQTSTRSRRIRQDVDIAPQTFECIDGLQRLTSLRMFMRNELSVFEGMLASDLRSSPFDPTRLRIRIAIYEFGTRAGLLQFYLDLNAGGTVHSSEELARVRDLLAQAVKRGAGHTPSISSKENSDGL
jgi:hypothetical protein